MVIQSTIEQLDVDDRGLTCAYTVNIEIGDAHHRILTVTTNNDTIASKWIKDVLKSYPGYMIAGICFAKYDRFTDYPYIHKHDDFNDVIQICVGSHCLIYNLSKNCGKFLDKFLGDYCLKAVGFDMANIAKRLKEKYGIVVKNPVELRKLATEKREDLYHYNLYKYDLGKLACAVLGNKYDMDWPEEKTMLIDLFESYRCCRMDPGPVSDAEKVMFATINPYLCFLIGEELIPEEDF